MLSLYTAHIVCDHGSSPLYAISIATLVVLSLMGVVSFTVATRRGFDETIPGQWSATTNQRDNWSIIWSCLVTVFICTWTVFHLDIDQRRPKNVVLSRRFQWFFVGVLAHEFIAITAIAAQFLRVWALRRKVIRDGFPNDGGLGNWSWMQYFYVDMGGFAVEYRNSNEMTVRSESGPIQLSVESVIALCDKNDASLFDVSPAVIKDRSKADWLAKVITVCQVSWFCAQTIGRGVEGLAITTFELVTMAFVATSAFTIAFWWNKPLDIKMPTIISLGPGAVDPEILDSISEVQGRSQMSLLEVPLIDAANVTKSSGLKQSFRQQVNNVSTPINVDSRAGPYLHFCIVTLLSVVFGLVHVVATIIGFPFPSDIESSLWFAGSLSTTILPPCLYVLYYTPLQSQTPHQNKKHQTLEIMRYIVLVLTGGIYFFSRLYLLFEPFFGLRKVEVGIYDQLNRVQYWPHVH